MTAWNSRRNASSNALYRHGDVLIRQIASLPAGVQRRSGATLAHGEATGHRHQMQPAQAVQLWERNGELFLEVIGASASLVHEEHRTIELSRGLYRVWKQREYRPEAYIEVED